MNIWIFGYGSLVSPESTGSTIRRVVEPGNGFAAAVLSGFGRRWNYGSLRQRADWVGPHGRVEAGVVVSLGIERSAGETTNGSIVRVSDDEVAHLDRRESDYDRVDVTDTIEASHLPAGDRVMTYVPRPSAIERYLEARADNRAAVRQGYVELVRGAFGDLGADELDRYEATTPTPDVPVLTFERRWLRES